MNLFFQIHSLQLLIFCMDDQEFVANLDHVLLFLTLRYMLSIVTLALIIAKKTRKNDLHAL